MNEEKIKQIFAKYEERDRIQGDCELTYVPEYNYLELAKEIVSQIEAPVMQKIAEVEEKYNELIMVVAKKFTNETRHQTALRYIQEAEKLEDNTPCKNESNFSA